MLKFQCGFGPHATPHPFMPRGIPGLSGGVSESRSPTIQVCGFCEVAFPLRQAAGAEARVASAGRRAVRLGHRGERDPSKKMDIPA